MVYHILNGESLAQSFGDAHIGGEIIVDREGLMDGDPGARTDDKDLEAFWHARAAYMEMPYEEYHRRVAAEFEKMLAAPGDSEFNLWFEYDLFCQVNMWFVISLLADMPVRKKVYAVYTSWLHREDKHFWNGYGMATSGQLRQAFEERILLSGSDIEFGHDLWAAYRRGDLLELHRISMYRSEAFPYLQEVVEAHMDRFPGVYEPGRPERVLGEIMKEGPTDFGTVFRKFWERESIYGFGDTQLRPLYEKVRQRLQI
jgi:hypothetical protein